MKASLLALIALAATTIAEAKNEVRERCAETTHAKFVSLETQLHDAMKEGVTDDATQALSLEGLEERIGVYLGGVVDESIRAVHAEFMAGQAPA